MSEVAYLNAIIDGLEAELVLTKIERDMYWEVYLCAKDVRDLKEMTGIPIRKDDIIKAEKSLAIVINDVEEQELGL